MNSGLIVSRIQRVLDTDGRGGDGSSVANDYAAAVKNANRRLNTGMSYLAETQQSEAIRIAEESPALLDECATLSFVQLPLWDTMCQDHGWALAEEVNDLSIEKLNAIYASATALEPLLRLYRKAVRMQDQFLVIRCLRRIIMMDKDNATWRQDLAAFEVKYIAHLGSQFKKMADTGDKDAMLRIAEEIDSGGWSVPIAARLLGDISDMRKADCEKKWQEQFLEDTDLLRTAYDAGNLQQTQKFIGNIQTIEMQGFVIPSKDKPLLEEVFAWCEQKSKEAKRVAARNQASIDLHKAIELENEAQIRELLSNPEFVESPPEEELERRARLVLQRFEIKRSRKRMQVCALIAIALISSGVAAGIKYRQVIRAKEKASLFVRLELALSNLDDAGLQNILSETKKDAPALYADSDVKLWEQKLAELVKTTSAQRQSFDLLMNEIQKVADTGFQICDDGAVRSDLDNAHAALPPNDLDREKQLAKVRVAFESYCIEKIKSAEQSASEKLNALVAQAAKLWDQLKTQSFTEDIDKRSTLIKQEFADWQSAYNNQFPQLEVKYVESISALNKADQFARSIFEQVKKIDSAKSLDEWISRRDTLIKYCSIYPEVQPLTALVKCPYSDVIDGTLGVIKKTRILAQQCEKSISLEPFNAICKDIIEFEKFETQVAMYAIYEKNGTLKDARVHSLGVPTLKALGDGTVVSGMLYQAVNGPNGFRDGIIKTSRVVTFAMMPHCKYLNNLINKATETSLDSEMMVHYLTEEVEKITVDTELTDYKRVQLLNVYYGYLSELSNLKVNYKFQTLSSKIQKLAQPLHIGNDRFLSWMYDDFKDVQDREKKCRYFLKQSGNLATQIRQVLCSQALFAKLANLKVVYIGSVRVRDKGLLNFVDQKASYGEIFVLRLDDNCYKLHHVLTKTGDRFFLRTSDTVLAPGEPLFVFSSGTKITALPAEVKSLRQIYSLAKKPDVRISYPPSWPVGLEVK